MSIIGMIEHRKRLERYDTIVRSIRRDLTRARYSREHVGAIKTRERWEQRILVLETVLHSTQRDFARKAWI